MDQGCRDCSLDAPLPPLLDRKEKAPRRIRPALPNAPHLEMNIALLFELGEDRYLERLMAMGNPRQ